MKKQIQTLQKNKRADLPGWTYIVGLILGLFAIIFLIWLSIKAGHTSVDQLNILRP